MNTISLNSIESLLSSSLTEVEAACGKVKCSFGELIDSAIDLASAERVAQSTAYSALDDEEENQQVNDALSLREDAKFDVTNALERTIKELAEQERVLNDTRTTLEQIRESLHQGNNDLCLLMQIGPKPGCVCSPRLSEK